LIRQRDGEYPETSFGRKGTGDLHQSFREPDGSISGHKQLRGRETGTMEQRYDIAIIGTGPAGVSAAITATARNKRVLLLGSTSTSDKVSKAHQIRNYPGLPEISGEDLAGRFLDHLKKMEIPITDRKVTMIYAMGEYFSLQIDQDFVEAKTVILTTGVSFGKPLPGEDENLGRGVSYCATCDAALYKGKEAVVVGWAPKEESDARFLAELAGKVVYLPVYKRADEEAMKDPLFPDRPNIEVRKDKPKRILKKDGRMVLETESGEIQTDGIFLLRESVSPDKLVPGLELDGNHVKVDRSMATNLPGMFAAGDITGAPYQYIKAAGEGNVAALSAVAWIDRA